MHPYLTQIADEVWSGLIQRRDDTGKPINRHIDAALRQYLEWLPVVPIPTKVVISGSVCSGIVVITVKLGAN